MVEGMMKMNLIEQYVEAVVGYVPKNIREKVWWEVRILIEEMLPENATEDEICETLEQLGEPRELAEKYYPQKRYLIGPDLYPQYLTVLKLVLGIVMLSLVSVTTITWIFRPLTEGTFIENLIYLFVELFSVIFEGVLQGAVWVTVIFAILERKNIKVDEIQLPKKLWSVKELQSSDKGKISRSEVTFSLIMTILLVAVLYLYPQIFAIYLENGIRIPFFEVGRLDTYLPAILLFGVAGFGFHTWQWFSPHWTLKMAMVNAVYNIGFCILVLTMLQDHLLLNPEFLAYFNDSSLNIICERWVGAFFIVINLFDSVNGFRKSKKY
jgi:hypothetical protein